MIVITDTISLSIVVTYRIQTTGLCRKVLDEWPLLKTFMTYSSKFSTKIVFTLAQRRPLQGYSYKTPFIIVNDTITVFIYIGAVIVFLPS